MRCITLLSQKCLNVGPRREIHTHRHGDDLIFRAGATSSWTQGGDARPRDGGVLEVKIRGSWRRIAGLMRIRPVGP
jgi:hypothetical protein